MQNSFSSVGFTKHTLTDPLSHVCCDLYLRPISEVLRGQIAGASTDNCFFQPPRNTGMFSHPMMTELGRSGVKAITDSIMGSVKDETLWHSGINAMLSSFVGLVQI